MLTALKRLTVPPEPSRPAVPETMPWRRLIQWMMLLCVTLLVAGCATVGDYCDVAQRPFIWQSDEEIDATPIRPLRWIETEAEIWERVCRR